MKTDEGLVEDFYNDLKKKDDILQEHIKLLIDLNIEVYTGKITEFKEYEKRCYQVLYKLKEKCKDRCTEFELRDNFLSFTNFYYLKDKGARQ